MRQFEKVLLGTGMDAQRAYMYRYGATKLIQFYTIGCVGAYYFMYHSDDWEQHKVSWPFV